MQTAGLSAARITVSLAQEEAPDREALMTFTKEDLEKAETFGN